MFLTSFWGMKTGEDDIKRAALLENLGESISWSCHHNKHRARRVSFLPPPARQAASACACARITTSLSLHCNGVGHQIQGGVDFVTN